jgi:hypothetical protein
MAAYVGRNGSLGMSASSSGLLTYIDSWSLNASVGTADITAYGDSAKKYAHTIRDASLSFTATMDRSNTGFDDIMDIFDGSSSSLVEKTCRLYSATTEYWAGQVLLTGMTVNSAVGDKVSLSFNAQVNGNLIYVTTGSTW